MMTYKTRYSTKSCKANNDPMIKVELWVVCNCCTKRDHDVCRHRYRIDKEFGVFEVKS